jgi:hypothetical protein
MATARVGDGCPRLLRSGLRWRPQPPGKPRAGASARVHLTAGATRRATDQTQCKVSWFLRPWTAERIAACRSCSERGSTPNNNNASHEGAKEGIRLEALQQIARPASSSKCIHGERSGGRTGIGRQNSRRVRPFWSCPDDGRRFAPQSRPTAQRPRQFIGIAEPLIRGIWHCLGLQWRWYRERGAHEFRRHDRRPPNATFWNTSHRYQQAHRKLRSGAHQ